MWFQKYLDSCEQGFSLEFSPFPQKSKFLDACHSFIEFDDVKRGQGPWLPFGNWSAALITCLFAMN